MAASPSIAGAMVAKAGGFRRAYRRVIAHWRLILLLLLLARAASLVIHAPEFGLFFGLFSDALLLIFIASQLFWIGRIVDVGERLLPGKPRRAWLAVIAGLVYLFIFTYSFPSIQSTNHHIFRAADYRLPSILIEAVFWWWFVGSMAAFLVLIAFGTADRAARAAAWVYGKVGATMQGHGAAPKLGAIAADPPLSARRRFLEQTAVLVSATPFVAAGYGLLYGRLDVEVVHQPIRLARLPKAFEGFRIAQLSDIHLSPFTSADHIRHCVTITNGLKPDLVALTGDYISWDQEAEGEAVHALAGLHAPYGVFACLGNHEEEGQTEESTNRLCAAEGIRILRQERASIPLRGEMLNLIGIDCPRGLTLALYRRDVNLRLQGLVMPATVNILLSHYPDVFDRAAELGVDLTLAGHTHGGQLSLDFIYRGLNVSHLLYRYDKGWYEKRGAQLYVNRGIGTTGFPIRLGCPPEITLLELTRQG